MQLICKQFFKCDDVDGCEKQKILLKKAKNKNFAIYN